GALVQLIASTQDNTFTTPNPTSFVGGSGDDIVESTFAMNSTGGTAGDLAKAINLAYSGNFAVGDQLLLRWWPTLSTGDTAPGQNTTYGEFRVGTVVDSSNIAWVAPNDGGTYALNFVTSSQGGSQPNSAGVASLTV